MGGQLLDQYGVLLVGGSTGVGGGGSTGVVGGTGVGQSSGSTKNYMAMN